MKTKILTKRGFQKATGTFMLAILAFVFPAFGADTNAPNANESKAQHDARMAWWHEAKFGMFIHWGVYSVTGGKYGNKNTYAEWMMNQAKIPLAQYTQLAKRFNPVKYDAATWVRIAKDAGMKYIIITAKHHDGFAMFPSKASDYNIYEATPFGRDPLKELAEACEKAGIKLGFYYSHAQDWGHAGGAVHGGDWDPAQAGDFDEYLDKIAVPQVRELLSNYGPSVPAVLWFDFPGGMTPERAARFYPILNTRPGLIFNSRMGGGFKGDMETPEQIIPFTGYPDRDWETCMTLNGHWGYCAADTNWKSAADLLHKLGEVASKGGNYLLNVGPTGEGLIPQPAVERLQMIGQWMKINSEAVYGTSAGPFVHQFWGCATRKGDLLYLHVFNWPKDGNLRVSLLSQAKTAYLLSAPDKKLEITQGKESLVIHVPADAPDENDSVVVLKLDGEPKARPLPTVGATLIATASQKGKDPKNVLDYDKRTFWMAPEDVKIATLEIDLERAQDIAGYGFDEPGANPSLNQTFSLEALVGETWQKVAEGKTEGHGQAGSFSPVTARKFKIVMNREKGAPAISKLQLYCPD